MAASKNSHKAGRVARKIKLPLCVCTVQRLQRPTPVGDTDPMNELFNNPRGREIDSGFPLG